MLLLTCLKNLYHSAWDQSLSLCRMYDEPGQLRAKVCLATHLVSSMKQQHAPRKGINAELVVHPHYPLCLQKFVAHRLPQPKVVDSYLVSLHRFFFSESLGGLLNTLCIFRIHKTSVHKNVLCGENPWYHGTETMFKGPKLKIRAS